MATENRKVILYHHYTRNDIILLDDLLNPCTYAYIEPLATAIRDCRLSMKKIEDGIIKEYTGTDAEWAKEFYEACFHQLPRFMWELIFRDPIIKMPLLVFSERQMTRTVANWRLRIAK